MWVIEDPAVIYVGECFERRSLNITFTCEIIVDLQKGVKIVQRGYMYSLLGFFHWFNLT